MVTLLHLSDLHRSHSEPINNDTLLSSLLADRDRYLSEAPKVSKPDFAVITGDIIQGVKLGEKNFSEELVQQYDVAFDFLTRLTELFFNGDRSRIAIVPGNHDICWNTAFSAMEKVASENEPKKIGPSLFGAHSKYRWNWSERQIYQIASSVDYEKRLHPYGDFIRKFYAGVELAFPIDPNEPVSFFELDSGRILLAAFNSVHGNDCFCNHGAIRAGTIGTTSLHIRSMFRQPLLQIAMWHHSLQGPPHRDDYMDPFAVLEMLGAGFKLGLHGHQHQADASAYNIHLPEEQSIAIVSAGSLCAGANELPRGTNRQYNIIEISENYAHARVHVREMVQGNQFGRCRQGLFGPDGYVDIDLEKKYAVGTKLLDQLEKYSQQTVIKAEDEIRIGNANKAFLLLTPLEKPEGSHARRLYLESAKLLLRWDEIILFLDPAKNADEFLMLLHAHQENKNFAVCIDLIKNSSTDFGIDAATSAAMQSRVELRQLIGK